MNKKYGYGGQSIFVPTAIILSYKQSELHVNYKIKKDKGKLVKCTGGTTKRQAYLYVMRIKNSYMQNV